MTDLYHICNSENGKGKVRPLQQSPYRSAARREEIEAAWWAKMRDEPVEPYDTPSIIYYENWICRDCKFHLMVRTPATKEETVTTKTPQQIPSILLRKRVQGPYMNAPAEIDYVVAAVRNSLRFSPNDVLTMSEVEKLCEDASWDVTIQ